MNLQISVSDFLKYCISHETDAFESGSTIRMIDFLLRYGFDYYEILHTVIQVKSTYSEDEVKFLCGQIPETTQIKDFEINTIHQMIPRWTATKYHTGPIQQVLRDIQYKCLTRQIGLYVYNSNLNLRNKKAANDPYVLMVTTDGIRFSDINRRRSFRYYYE